MTDDLPRRPRVIGGLDVLRRRPDEIQIGLDPRHAVVAGGLPEAVVAAARRLTGRCTVDDLLTELTDPDGRAALLELLRELTDYGLVTDAPPPPLTGRLAADASSAEVRRTEHPSSRRELSVLVRGDGRLAVSVGCLLAAAGVGWVHVLATGSVRPEDTGTGYLADDVGRRRRSAAADAVTRADPTTRTTGFRGGALPDLVLLTDALVPAPEQVSLLTATAVPHLSVRVREGVGIVGPLVLPGLTSCLRCADLHRCARDGCWPQLAAQLAGRVQLADLACTQATAALAAGQALDALRYLRHERDRPVTWNASVELDPATATIRHRGWPAHPECPCGAAPRPRQVAANTSGWLRESTCDGDAS
jgi:bacteriocin biosynthesis cyclodehydratase domain-containing protein